MEASLDGATITEELELDTNPKAVEAMANGSRNFALENMINYICLCILKFPRQEEDKQPANKNGNLARASSIFYIYK